MSEHDSSKPPAPEPESSDRGALFLLLAWAAATGSSLGSLFFSEVMELPPCSLCWYQRCFMFPLALVLLVGVLRSDKQSIVYALPLTIGGWLLAAYHILVHTGIIPESATPCQQGVSCSEVQFELFGFASIPMLSLTSFTGIALLLLLAKRNNR